MDDVPKEIKTALYAGFQLRKHELTGEKFYKLGEGGTYIPLDKKPGDDVQGIVCMTINTAMSYSPQEFGKMRESDPAKHAIIRPLRDAFSDYAGNCLRDLKAAVRRKMAAGQPRQRVKTAKDRGDVEADPVKFKLAVDAFWKAYNA